MKKEVVDGLRKTLSFQTKKFLRDVYREYNTLNVVLPPESELNPTILPHPIHFREGLMIRNRLGVLGVPRVAPDGTYYLDDVWEEYALAALGLT